MEERLPKSPLVIEPFDEIGEYGGTLRYGYPQAPEEPYAVVYWEFLTRWKVDMSGVTLNVVMDMQANEDAAEYTLVLREGMKWSDGYPFTADDILFAINDIWLNPELNPFPPTELIVGGEPLVLEKIDDLTLKITFAAPYGLFPEIMACWPGRFFTRFPKHWLEQYHIKYNPEGVQEMLDEGMDNSPWAGPIETWVDLFTHYSQYQNDAVWAAQAGRPTLGPWIVTQSYLEGNGNIILERNPYYWKVDTEGNQLPYIDRIVGTSFPSYETMLLSALEGKIDSFKDPRIDDRALFLSNQDVAHLQVYNTPSDSASIVSLHFNQTIPDPVKAAIYADKTFRIGISHATNRQQIIDIVYWGEGEPRQLAPFESSPLYNEQLATQYLEYNPELANAYLDKVLPNRDEEGFRLMPNGERLVVDFPVTDEYGLSFPQVVELLALQWEQVGIDVEIELISGNERWSRELTNAIEAFLYTGEGGAGLNAVLDARYFVPVTRFSYFGLGWALWFLSISEEDAVEPPERIKNLYALYQQAQGTPNPDTRIELMREVMQIAADEFFVMGISSPLDRYAVFNEDIGNIPDTWYDGFVPGMQSITHPEQWYFRSRR